MTRKQFQSLKPGDLILWRKRYLRTVIQGPRWPSGAITIPIHNRSWTRRAYTVRFFNDVKDFAEVTGKRTAWAALKSELLRLKEIGFNPRKEYFREIREKRGIKLRMGRELCKTIRPLPHLTAA